MCHKYVFVHKSLFDFGALNPFIFTHEFESFFSSTQNANNVYNNIILVVTDEKIALVVLFSST